MSDLPREEQLFEARDYRDDQWRPVGTLDEIKAQISTEFGPKESCKALRAMDRWAKYDYAGEHTIHVLVRRYALTPRIVRGAIFLRKAN